MQKTYREITIEWWNKLSIIERSQFCIKYSTELFGRGSVSLTGREIEMLYIKETSTQQ